MIEEMIAYHNATFWLFLAAVCYNFLVSLFFREPFSKIIRIGYFFFWALFSMVIFSGLIVFITVSGSFDLQMNVMVLGLLLIGIIEFLRVRANKRVWLQGNAIKRNSSVLILVQIFIILLMYVWMMP